MDNLAYDYRDELKYEILNGEKVMMSPRPRTNHSVVAGNIYRMFSNFLRRKKCTPFFEHEVYLSEDDTVIPDVIIVCDRSKIGEMNIKGAPDLVVEVLSPSTSRIDRSYKKQLYEKHEVGEYWLVDILNREITVYILKDGKYATEKVYTLIPDDILEDMSALQKSNVVTKFRTDLYEDLIIDLEEVFENLI